MGQRVLVTGAFGAVGKGTLRELVRQGCDVTALDLPTIRTRRAARQFAGHIRIRWADVRLPNDVATALVGQDVVIHLAAIIPPRSETDPATSHQVNVEGTRNVLAACAAQDPAPKLIYASSYALFGRDQSRPPPRTLDDPVLATDHYTRHKAACERLIKDSGLTWAIMRLSAVVPIEWFGTDVRLKFREMFEVPLDQRIECVHVADLGLALANAAASAQVWGQTWLIGGGPRFQIRQGDFYRETLNALGIGMFGDEAFGTAPYHTDWVDTAASEALLHYQRIGFDDYLRELQTSTRNVRRVNRLLAPLLRALILRESRYHASSRSTGNGHTG